MSTLGLTFISAASASAVWVGFAAGAMIWMVFSELIPDALESASSKQVAMVVTLSIATKIAFRALLLSG